MPRKRRGRGEGAVFFSESKSCWIARAVVGVQPSGKQRVKEVSAKTKGEVLVKKKKAEETASGGRLGDVAGLTLGQFLDHWLNNVSKPSVEPTTWPSYERCVRLHLKPRVGGIKLEQLRPLHIETLFAEMQKDGISGGNAKKVSEILSTALEHAVRVEMVRSNPAASVPKPRAEGEEIVPFTREEIMRIRSAAAGNRLEALFALAISTGAREGEILGLGWEHVDFEEATIHIQRALAVVPTGFLLKKPKSQRGNRVIELPPFAVELLAGHRKKMVAEGNGQAAVIFCTKTGNFIGKSNLIRQVYAPLLEKADVDYRKFHTFRHTHVSELLHRGESVMDVARRIGDRPEVILKTYAKFLPGNGGRIASRLEKMYG
jgi:integrase